MAETPALDIIPKAGGGVAPNLTDYDAARRDFSWEAARAALPSSRTYWRTSTVLPSSF